MSRRGGLFSALFKAVAKSAAAGSKASVAKPVAAAVKAASNASGGKPRGRGNFRKQDFAGYPVGIVGESRFQDAIERCAVGEAASIEPEPDNPHDNLALVVISARGQPIGYIARDHWLRKAIHGEDREVRARIASLKQSKGGDIGVVLDVEVED